MMAADSLRFIVPSGVSSCWPSSCRCVCRAGAYPIGAVVEVKGAADVRAAAPRS
ncbi:hypothetical protein [Paraburkholderia silvatlantica]|uniref:Uncharacterized protein n=1 Tax=Paraburkholderia silvatlantica TaxID=321895 RepID=A0ABR6FQY3_9BURK|nr:hypothetical protein [Paraburkholderia silvatlantica]MBB2929839.1 hypothetical protein [Paraburkholderia silvatlantica]PVY34864.1 hypothetical protein C7411_10647 [Paraburkholderia silvatlantica]PXW39274.1 hypothetical protein C7413_10647 [Paraburkholderia silvatlantica]